MSQRDGFTGGLLLGTILGGVVGGVVGALAASRPSSNNPENNNKNSNGFLDGNNREGRENPEESIEAARLSLENKIAQLNLAIDDVRQQLGSVNHNNSEVDS